MNFTVADNNQSITPDAEKCTTGVPRMVTAQKAAELSGLKKFHIMHLAEAGKIPTLKAGKKLLVNLDRLIDYMNTATEAAPEPEPLPAKKRTRGFVYKP